MAALYEFVCSKTLDVSIWLINRLALWSVIAIAIVLLGWMMSTRFRSRSASFQHCYWLSLCICIVLAPLGTFWTPRLLPDLSYLDSNKTSSSEPSFHNKTSAEILHDEGPSELNNAKPSISEPESLRIDPTIIGAETAEVITDGNRSPAFNKPLESEDDASRSVWNYAYVGATCLWLMGVIWNFGRACSVRNQLRKAFEQSYCPTNKRLLERIQNVLTEHGFEAVYYSKPTSKVRFARRIAIHFTHREMGPFIWGSMPPKLLLPQSIEAWPDELQESALRHEIAHAIRVDEWTRRLVLLLRICFWFHFFVRYCCNRVQLFAEQACDDYVVRSGCSAIEYSKLLLKLSCESPGRAIPQMACGMFQSDVSPRIRSLLDPNISRKPIAIPESIALLSCAFLVSLMFTTLRVVELPSDETVSQSKTRIASEQSPLAVSSVDTHDWNQWGGSPSRNNVAQATNPPLQFDIANKSVRWSTQLGSQSYGGVVVANGKVFTGTNNDAAYQPKIPREMDLGVLACFDEANGSFLWQHSNKKLTNGRVHDWPMLGQCSAPWVVGDRLWYVNNRCELVCLDTNGFRDGENDGPFVSEEFTESLDADVIWVLDMRTLLNVRPHHMSNCSVTGDGELLFVSTSQGALDGQSTPEERTAPSFICVHRTTGKLIWADNSPNENILQGQWSSPAFGILGGIPQVVFGGGDGYLYSFLAQGENGNSKLLWKFDCNPKDSIYQLNSGTRNSIVGTPVIYEGLVYVGVGLNPELGEGPGHLWCIDPNKRGDVSPTLLFNRFSGENPIPNKRLQALDSSMGDFEKPNPNSAMVWHYRGNDVRDFEQTMHRTCGAVAIKNDLLFTADFSGVLHCVNAKTGVAYWTLDLLATSWASPCIVGDYVYVCDEDGDLLIVQCAPQRKIVFETNLNTAIFTTPVFANNTLYVAGTNRLFAFRNPPSNP